MDLSLGMSSSYNKGCVNLLIYLKLSLHRPLRVKLTTKFSVFFWGCSRMWLLGTALMVKSIDPRCGLYVSLFLKRANRWSPRGAVSKRVVVTSAAPFLFALSADSKAANETNGIQNKRSHRKNWFTPSTVTLLGDFLFSGLRHLPAPAMEKGNPQAHWPDLSSSTPSTGRKQKLVDGGECCSVPCVDTQRKPRNSPFER